MIPPGAPHAADAPTDAAPDDLPMAFRVAHLDPALVDALAGPGTLPRWPHAAPAVHDAPRLRAAFGAWFRAMERPEATLVREARLARWLARWLAPGHGRGRGQGPTGRPADAPAGVRHARALLLDRLEANVSTAALAAAAGLSPRHLRRAFAAAYGLPPHALQRQARVERARVLLAGGVPVAQVAFALGFADQSHFTRAFVRLVGVPPGRFAAASRARQTAAGRARRRPA